MKTLLAALLLIFARPAHAQVAAPASFTLALSSCTPAPPAPTATFPDGNGGTLWAYLRDGDVWPCTVNVPIAGDYTVSGFASSAWSGTSFHFESPKGTKIGTLTAPNTGSWDWRTRKPISSTVTFPAGQIPLFLILDTAAVNLGDVLTFTYIQPPQPFVFTLNGFGSFTFPMQVPPDCSAGDCSLVWTGPNGTVTLLPGQSGSLVIRKPTGDVVVVQIGP